jgi:hypothetical protein
VKALADISLADGQASTVINFEEDRTMSWKDRVKNLFTQAVDEIPESGSPQVVIAQPAPQPVQSYSEEQVRALEQAAAESAARQAREQAQTEFAEELRRSRDADAARVHAESVQARVSALVDAGKVLPAWVASGLAHFAEGLAWRDADRVEFSEGCKNTPSDWFLSFLEALPPSVHLGETAGRDKDVSAGGAAQKLEQLVQKKVVDGKLSYAAAFADVQREHPELAREYLGEVRR